MFKSDGKNYFDNLSADENPCPKHANKVEKVPKIGKRVRRRKTD